MIWTDIIVEQMISDHKICSILKTTLNIPLNKIKVVNDYEDFPEANTMTAVCQKSIFDEGFSLMLSIYLYGELIESILDIEKFCKKFSSLSNSRLLVPTDEDSPCQMRLFDGEKIEIVYLDEDKLDNDGQYCIKEQA